MKSAVAALGLVLAGWPLAAFGQTIINPDVGAARGLGTTVNQAGTVFTVDGGTRAGNNLFHSFQAFSLSGGDTARWVRGAGDGGSIANVVNRVTGGQVSTIAGTLDSTALPNAAFWFINPAGIVFGAGAVVNVPSAAHFSTAANLNFADGTSFAVAAPDGSTLSMAAPEAFGFVGGQGAISITGVGAGFVPGDTALSFTASDIAVANASFAAGGLDMVAVGGGAADVALAAPLAGTYTGDLRLTASTLNTKTADAPGAPFRLGGGLIDVAATRLVTDTTGLGAGADLVLTGDQIRIGPDSFVITSTGGPSAGGAVLVTARDLLVDGTDATTTTTGFTSISTGAGAAGVVRLTADSIRLIGGAFIGSSVDNTGAAGNIQVVAKDLVLDTALISSYTLGPGAGGDVRLTADRFELGASNIVTGAFGTGVSGDVILDGGSMFLSGGSIGSIPGGTGDSGNVFVNLTGRLEAEGGTFGVASLNDYGPTIAAGGIHIRASELVMHQTGFFTLAAGQGAPGRVLIEAGDVALDEVFYLGDAKDGVGALPGLFRLNATGDIFVRNLFFRSNANGLADGGVIEFQGRNIEMVGSIVQTDAAIGSFGDAGRILVKATGNLNLNNTLLSSGTGGDGDAGDVRVEAGAISLDFFSEIRSDAKKFSTGRAGAVSVKAGTLDLQGVSAITSESQVGAVGDAGEVFIDVGRLTMGSNAFISSTTKSDGQGGTVTVHADEIVLDGESQGFTSIVSETYGDGNGGNIFIKVNKLTLDRTALISTVSLADADAGDIRLEVGELRVLNASYVQSSGLEDGDSGDIDIVAGRMEVRADMTFLPAFVSSAAVFGTGGDIRIQVGALLLDYGGISSDAFVAGNSGDVSIDADSITMRNFAGISSNTSGFGDAGAIDIVSKSLVMESGAGILSAATASSDGGNAGSVSIVADKVVIGKDANVTTSTFAQGDAGFIEIRAASLRVDGGHISSAADVLFDEFGRVFKATGSAQGVKIFADDLAVVNGGTIDTLSINPNPAGAVEIHAGSLLVDGRGSVINSENFAGDSDFGTPGAGDAGTILIFAGDVTLSNGGRISTNSVAGAAGDIRINIPRPGFFTLEGDVFPGVIQTSSGPGTGGKITITDPLAIISNGGAILALGEQAGANVQIQSLYFINSTDRFNVVSVDGDFELQSGLYDVSSGTVSRDLSVLDASKVLRGQCPAARASGAVSQLITRPVGPYAREPSVDVLERPAGAAASPLPATPGGCP